MSPLLGSVILLDGSLTTPRWPATQPVAQLAEIGRRCGTAGVSVFPQMSALRGLPAPGGAHMKAGQRGVRFPRPIRAPPSPPGCRSAGMRQPCRRPLLLVRRDTHGSGTWFVPAKGALPFAWVHHWIVTSTRASIRSRGSCSAPTSLGRIVRLYVGIMSACLDRDARPDRGGSWPETDGAEVRVGGDRRRRSSRARAVVLGFVMPCAMRKARHDALYHVGGYLTQVGWRSAADREGLPGGTRGVAGVVPGRGCLSGLPRVAALAGRVALPAVRGPDWLAAEQRSLGVCGIQA